MKTKKALEFTSEMFLYPLFIVMSIWIVFWLDLRFELRLSKWGIYPQKISGLKGVFFSPFLHSGLQHLFNNSIPFLALSTALFYFYKNIRWKVLLIGTLCTGILTWSIGRPAMHIGASGVVYMLAAFLFFKGMFSKQFQLTALSLIVVFLYGGLLWYLLPIDPKISWEGHLSGFVVGGVLALLFKKNSIEDKKYDWEQPDFDPEKDPFISQFDANGNFIERKKEELTEAYVNNTLDHNLQIDYIIVKKPLAEQDIQEEE